MPLELFTHVFYAFASVHNDTTIDDSTLLSLNAIADVKAQHSGLQIYLSIGGYVTNANFTTLYHNADTFAANVLSYCRLKGFDGVDLDWEYPLSDADKAGYTTLATALQNAFTREPGPNRLGLSMTLPASSTYGQ